MSMDWRSLPAVIAPSSSTKQQIEVIKRSDDNSDHDSSDNNENHQNQHKNDDIQDHIHINHEHHDDDDNDDDDNDDDDNNHNPHIPSNSDDDDDDEREEEEEEDDDDEEEEEEEEEDNDDDEYDEYDELKQKEIRRSKRREKHLSKIKEVYGDYLSDGSTTTNSTTSASSTNGDDIDEDNDDNLLQTVRYRPPRKTRGCPHWRIGCKFEGDEQSLNNHIINDCCFEKMKAMIKKRDHQINKLQNSCSTLQHQVHQLHSLLSSFVSLQSPQLQNYLMSHLPNDNISNKQQQQSPLSLIRNISSELYDAPHTAINLSLHSLDDNTRSVAYERRKMNRESIRKHEMSIGGQLGLIWRSRETIIGYDDDIDININNSDSLLNPTVNYIKNNNNNNSNNNNNNNNNGLLALPSFNGYKNGKSIDSDNNDRNKKNKDIAIRSLVLFWNKVISTSALGVQIWDIETDENEAKLMEHDEEKMEYNTLYNDTPIFGQHIDETAKIQGLSHNGWLFNESSFGVATQPFSHPYWLFTGHKQEIRIWKYNGFTFNTSCNCNACNLSFTSQGYGDVRCIAVSSEYIFASSDSNIIQFWKFTKTEQNTNINSNGNPEELKRNISGSSIHSVGASTLDKRINAIGNVQYLGNLICGHRGMITSLKVFGDVLISGSKDGFITIWSATQMVNLSILHYGSNPVLDFTIFPNPYPLCHITIWNEHLNALKKLHHNNNINIGVGGLKQEGKISNNIEISPNKHIAATQTNVGIIDNDDDGMNARWPSLPNDINNDEHELKSNPSPMPVIQYVSLNSLYESNNNNNNNDDDIEKKQRNTIQDTIRSFCGSDNNAEDILNSDDAPDVLKSVFMAAIPSTPGSSSNGNGDGDELENESPPIPAISSQQQQEEETAAAISSKQSSRIHSASIINSCSSPTIQREINRNNEVRVLSREIMHNASSHFASMSLIIQDLKLIVGGTSGEIHIWHIGNNRSTFNSTTTWERERILRGHGDRVTCLESFGTHLMSAYSNGSIKLWKWDDKDFVCTGTAYTNPSKRVGSADTVFTNNDDPNDFGNNFNKISSSYYSVRSVLLLPSPNLNLNHLEDRNCFNNHNNQGTWNNFDDEQDNYSDDEMELNFNEFNVKISPNHNDKIYNGHNRNKHHHHHNHNHHHHHHHHHHKKIKKNYHDNEFWILSGTSDGSMLLHKLYNDDNNHHHIHQNNQNQNNIHNDNYNDYL